MKKLTSVIALLAIITIVTGCEKKSQNNPKDDSKSYECILETKNETVERRIEHIVSVDGKGKIVTYNEVDNGSYTSKEEFDKICEENKLILKRFEEKYYEHALYGNSCTEDSLAVSSGMSFDYQNLTEEEKTEIPNITKHVSKEGKFNSKAWMLEEEKEGYKCS